jgi:hypothetical protein
MQIVAWRVMDDNVWRIFADEQEARQYVKKISSPRIEPLYRLMRKDEIKHTSSAMDQGEISDRLTNFDDWGDRIKERG